MNEIFHTNSLYNLDPRLVQLKDFLTGKVSMEMQEHIEAERRDPSIVRQWLVEALQGTPAADLELDLADQGCGCRPGRPDRVRSARIAAFGPGDQRDHGQWGKTCVYRTFRANCLKPM